MVVPHTLRALGHSPSVRFYILPPHLSVPKANHMLRHNHQPFPHDPPSRLARLETTPEFEAAAAATASSAHNAKGGDLSEGASATGPTFSWASTSSALDRGREEKDNVAELRVEDRMGAAVSKVWSYCVVFVPKWYLAGCLFVGKRWTRLTLVLYSRGAWCRLVIGQHGAVWLLIESCRCLQQTSSLEECGWVAQALRIFMQWLSLLLPLI